MVISSTFVNTTFLINHLHECQHNCARFFATKQTRNTFFFFFLVGKKSKGREKKDRISVLKIIYWVVNSRTCIALFHNFWKVHFLHILCFKYEKLFVQRSVLGNSRQLLSFFLFKILISSALEMTWMWASKMLTCRPWWGILLSLVRCTELFFAFCREKKQQNLWLFKKKNVGKKNFGEKKDVFFIGAPIHCVYKLLWILTKDMFLLVFFSPHSHRGYSSLQLLLLKGTILFAEKYFQYILK